MDDETPAFGAADLSNCDREPIHIPGSIQPHGALLALDADSLTVAQAGGNTRQLLGFAPRDLIGKPIEDWLSAGRIGRLRDLLDNEGAMIRPLHAFRMNAVGGNRGVDVTAHFSDGSLILEFEPVYEDIVDDSLALVQTMIRSVQEADSVAAFCQSVADVVRQATNFDRVMVYRFLPDGSGAVDAEAKDPALAPFLGLHYPASDIPKQARDLYLRNWIRLIADARYEPAPLEPVFDAQERRPLDLSQSALRSVSPIHLEYLGNMGVAATMSLSIILDGKLWGLVACHSRTPRFVAHRLRVALELFSQMASFLLETKITAAELELRSRSKVLHDRLLTHLAGVGELADALEKLRPSLLDIISADGLGLWIEGRYTHLGRAPDADQAAGLVGWLNETAEDGVFHTSALPKLYAPAVDFADVASGIIALSVSKTPRDYVIWFRPEIIETVTWAGNPDKSVSAEPDGQRLSPRKSFAAWKQEVRLQSRPWSSVAIQTAQALRVSLLEVVLRRVDQIARERETARQRQDALLVALDHRIRQWETTAQQLKIESDRRAVVEAELSEVLRSTVINQEAERQRIARELHDSLGQYLTVMQLDLDGIGRDVDSSPAVKRRVADLKNLTANLGKEVNRLAWEIRPTALDDLGLQTAIQQFLEEWGQKSGLQFDLHLALSDRRLPPIVETTLYRILQEAITNVVKHSQAKKAGVILKATSSEAIMIVEDDGRGFLWDDVDSATKPSSRLGLLGVRERLSLVGGKLEIETSPGHGATLFIHVPL
ncbi:multi-sensor signal transduction histidine kinase [Methylocella silvestris BL2]|uniref:histidine kinase n=1 Tax=Methylocella silvestris (strain DSM 15510 / CIP 108128 / LMG 27833 / NCIMB 13906 / BL2) TaxID=395965 RepID=B8EPV6_METSB|nr:GAF domain-containing protein [Methylocella silvestris]ACK50960.1 multi-sensor signal transduction histidine kinase [Methylocella silvestris BL2]